MRKDIKIHIDTGDISIESTNNFVLRDFNWIDNPGWPVRYIYGEVTIPADVTESYIREYGFYTHIPYTAKYKEFYIRVKRQFPDGSSSYVYNMVDGGVWFLAKAGIYGETFVNAYASKLPLISEDSFYIKLGHSTAIVYSSLQSDLQIIQADTQNKNLLLKCNPTNCYRYPTSGVGASKWINCTDDLSSFAARIKSEFLDDDVVVKDVTYNRQTKELSISSDTVN